MKVYFFLVIISFISGALFTFTFFKQSPVDKIPASISKAQNFNKDDSNKSAPSKPIDKITDTSIAELKDLLSKSNKEIGYLQRVNQELSEKYNLEPKADNNQELLFEKIDRLPESFIEKKLADQYGKDALETISDSKEFSKNLLSAALNDIDHKELDNITINFSFSPILNNKTFSGSISTGLEDTLFAFISNDGETKNVIVKWYNTTNQKLVSFKKMQLSTNPQHNYISARPRNGWTKGTYRVTVYHLNQSVSPLGSRTFSVNNIEEIENNNSNSIVLELIANGQARPKQPSN